MPWAPLRRCNWPAGCPVKVAGGRCAAHQPVRQKPQRTTAERGYGAAHQAIELLDYCERCGSPYDLHRAHIVAVEDGGTNDPSNYLTLCRTCNNRQAAHDTKARR